MRQRRNALWLLHRWYRLLLTRGDTMQLWDAQLTIDTFNYFGEPVPEMVARHAAMDAKMLADRLAREPKKVG